MKLLTVAIWILNRCLPSGLSQLWLQTGYAAGEAMPEKAHEDSIGENAGSSVTASNLQDAVLAHTSALSD